MKHYKAAGINLNKDDPLINVFITSLVYYLYNMETPLVPVYNIYKAYRVVYDSVVYIVVITSASFPTRQKSSLFDGCMSTKSWVKLKTRL